MTRIYIGNLSFKTTEELLTSQFSEFGTVEEVTILKDKFTGASKGFGFVNMQDEDAAFNAIRSLNGTMLDGRKIRVSLAEDKGQTNKRR